MEPNLGVHRALRTHRRRRSRCDWAVRRSRPFAYKPFVVSGVAVLLVVIGVYDQTSPAIIPDSHAFQSEWNSDAVFVKQIERVLGPGGKVFQLPYLPFPEAEVSVPPYGMVDYDPLRGYLHSDDLYWGYGGTRGRQADWQGNVVEQATPKMLDAITAVGFDGLWIDTLGYPGHAEQIIDEVTAATGETPIVSPNDRFVFFDLRDYQRTGGAAPRQGRRAVAQAAHAGRRRMTRVGRETPPSSVVDLCRHAGRAGGVDVTPADRPTVDLPEERTDWLRSGVRRHRRRLRGAAHGARRRARHLHRDVPARVVPAGPRDGPGQPRQPPGRARSSGCTTTCTRPTTGTCRSGSARVVLHDLREAVPTDGATLDLDLGERPDGTSTTAACSSRPASRTASPRSPTWSSPTSSTATTTRPTSSAWRGTTPRSTADWGVTEPILSERDQANPGRADLAGRTPSVLADAHVTGMR